MRARSGRVKLQPINCEGVQYLCRTILEHGEKVDHVLALHVKMCRHFELPPARSQVEVGRYNSLYNLLYNLSIIHCQSRRRCITRYNLCIIDI